MVKMIRKIVFKLYVVALMGFTVWYGIFMFPLIFGFAGKEEAAASLRQMGKAGTEEERMFVKLIAEQTQTTTTDLGYKVIEQPYIEGRFHHIGFQIDPDMASPCIRCHGTVPHDKSKEVRSFLNMHAFYLACETCHVLPKKGEAGWQFRWMDKKTGRAVGNPQRLVNIDIPHQDGEQEEYKAYGNYGAKIAPGYMENSRFRFISTEKEMDAVLNYIKKQDMLGTAQQSQMKKVIHRKVGNKPLQCTSCHTEKAPYVPFAGLGYPPRRLEELTSTSVVGMIQKYKKFWIPSFLTPGQHHDRKRDNQAD